MSEICSGDVVLVVNSEQILRVTLFWQVNASWDQSHKILFLTRYLLVSLRFTLNKFNLLGFRIGDSNRLAIVLPTKYSRYFNQQGIKGKFITRGWSYADQLEIYEPIPVKIRIYVSCFVSQYGGSKEKEKKLSQTAGFWKLVFQTRKI